MSEVSTKIKFLIFILIISFLINLAIGVTSLVGTDTYNLSGGDIINQEQHKEQNLSVLGLISIPTFMLPYMSIISLTSLNLPTEIFAFVAVIIGIIETIKTFLYIAIVWNFIPTTNV
jgi:hypothetical protein